MRGGKYLAVAVKMRSESLDRNPPLMRDAFALDLNAYKY